MRTEKDAYAIYGRWSMKTLRYGEEGLYIRYLQTLLKRAGEDPGNTDGIFGRKTLRALTAFQTANGLRTDGIVGQLTWTALYPYLVGSTIVVLREGDSPYRLAQQYMTTVSAIKTANPSANWYVGEQVVVPFAYDVVDRELTYSSFLTAAVSEGLKMRYPFLGYEVFGRSVMGKELEVIRIGNGPLKVGINAAHHANEWITTPLTLLFLERYAKAYAENANIGGVPAKSLFEGATLMLVPLVNPDGVDLVTGLIDPSDSFYQSAKALAGYYPSIPFPDGWKANISGIDLNLGYPAGWEQARTIKFTAGFTRPGPCNYVGTRPLESPENQAMAEFTIREDFDRVIAYHTQGEEIYWEYRSAAPVGSETLAITFSEASGYRTASAPFESSFAGYKDWFIDRFERSGFTVEAGKGTNPLPVSDLNKIYTENEGILVSVLSRPLRA